MIKIISKFYDYITYIPNEENALKRFFLLLNLSPNQKVLDVGCGFGAKLKILSDMGIKSLGVDINPKAVKKNIDSNLDCMTVEQFEKTDIIFDAVLMSHVIEHFKPADLKVFMEYYLSRLRPGGHLIIATPIYSPSFYDDFDHIRPYHPIGISMVFGDNTAQVQYYSDSCIVLEDIWFRRKPFKFPFFKGYYVSKYSPRCPKLVNLFFAILFRISFGMIGKTTGWIGLYRKAV